MKPEKYYKAKEVSSRIKTAVLDIIKECVKRKSAELPIYYENWVKRLYNIDMLVLDLKYS